MEEMEETVEAAAILIKYMGPSILEEKCGQLVAKASRAEQAADAVGVIRTADLNRAARELEEAGEEGRLQAVVNLRAAAVALVGSLEGEAREQLRALRGAAASLGRSCEEFRGAALAMVEVQRAKEEGLREPLVLHDVEAAARPEDEMVDQVDVAVTLDLLSQGVPQLRQKGVDLVVQAGSVADAAKVARVPCGQLESAIDAFPQAADLAALLSWIGDLGAAARWRRPRAPHSRMSATKRCACRVRAWSSSRRPMRWGGWSAARQGSVSAVSLEVGGRASAEGDVVAVGRERRCQRTVRRRHSSSQVPVRGVNEGQTWLRSR